MAVFPVPGWPAISRARPAILPSLIISRIKPAARRAFTWPTIPWLTARASRLSLRPRPRIWECAPRREKDAILGKARSNRCLPVRSMRVTSRTCCTWAVDGYGKKTDKSMKSNWWETCLLRPLRSNWKNEYHCNEKREQTERRCLGRTLSFFERLRHFIDPDIDQSALWWRGTSQKSTKWCHYSSSFSERSRTHWSCVLRKSFRLRRDFLVRAPGLISLGTLFRKRAVQWCSNIRWLPVNLNYHKHTRESKTIFIKGSYYARATDLICSDAFTCQTCWTSFDKQVSTGKDRSSWFQSIALNDQIERWRAKTPSRVSSPFTWTHCECQIKISLATKPTSLSRCSFDTKIWLVVRFTWRER